MSKQDYYQILEINRTATPDEIKRAYRRLVLKYHPDKNGGSDVKFKEIGEAYGVLSDPVAKREYDETGSISQSSWKRIESSPRPEDYLSAAYKAIGDALKKHQVREKDLEPEYSNLFGHSQCEAVGRSVENDYFYHIVCCLFDYVPVENFKDQVLALIDKYVAELNSFKEESIRRIEKYLEKLSARSKKMFEDYERGLVKRKWREYIREDDWFSAKSYVTDFENSMKELIDEWKKNNTGLEEEIEKQGQSKNKSKSWEELFEETTGKFKKSHQGNNNSDNGGDERREKEKNGNDNNSNHQNSDNSNDYNNKNDNEKTFEKTATEDKSKNKYHQQYKQEAQKLLARLESRQTQNPSDNKFPYWLWVVGGGVFVALGLTLLFVAKNNKKKRKLLKR